MFQPVLCVQLPTMLVVVADSQQSFDTEIGQTSVSDCVGGRHGGHCSGGSSSGSSGSSGRRDLRGYRLVPLVLVPLTLRVLPVTDQRAHLTEAFAAGFARKRFVLHVNVSVEISYNIVRKCLKNILYEM